MHAPSLFDFTAPEATPSDWRSVDDPVMGGVSESTFTTTDAGAAFTGTVSLERGGGFCSVRAPEGPYDLSAADGLRLRLRGDGHRYWITFYTTSAGPVSYRTPRRPPEQWSDGTVPFADLTPYRRGTKHPAAPPFSPAQVRTFGVLIADKQAGPFRLEIKWIHAEGSLA
ncbi:MAG: CIA30 family protein [Salinibacter sp.]